MSERLRQVRHARPLASRRSELIHLELILVCFVAIVLPADGVNLAQQARATHVVARIGHVRDCLPPAGRVVQVDSPRFAVTVKLEALDESAEEVQPLALVVRTWS